MLVIMRRIEFWHKSSGAVDLSLPRENKLLPSASHTTGNYVYLLLLCKQFIHQGKTTTG